MENRIDYPIESIQKKENQLVLIIHVDSIFMSWQDQSSCQSVCLKKVGKLKEPEKQTELLQIFDYLTEKNKATKVYFPIKFCVFIQSNQEVFLRSFIFLDFEQFFNLSNFPPGLQQRLLLNHRYIEDILQWDTENALENEKNRWKASSADLMEEFLKSSHTSSTNSPTPSTHSENTNSFLSFLLAYPLEECQEEIIQLTKEKNFYADVIPKKILEYKQKGLAFYFDPKYINPNNKNDNTRNNSHPHSSYQLSLSAEFVGFVLFRYQRIDPIHRNLQVFIEYLLVKENTKGYGSQVLSCLLKWIESEFPAMTIHLFTEAMLTETAKAFWMKKMNFQLIEKQFIQEVYYPVEKIYPAHSHAYPHHSHHFSHPPYYHQHQ